MTASLSIDARGLDGLRRESRGASREALEGAAKQFEAVFMQMMLKSMRDAVPQSDVTGGDESRLYTGMLDGELAQRMAGKGGGIAQMIVRQLERATLGVSGSGAALGAPDDTSGLNAARGNAKTAASENEPAIAWKGVADALASLGAALPGAVVKSATKTGEQGAAQTPANVSIVFPSLAAERASESTAPKGEANAGRSADARAFIDRMLPHALEAERATGVPAQFILGQAGLESGWGKREIRATDGSGTFNLFGIKAGRGWTGGTAEALTTEYVRGVARKTTEKFRAYGSYAEAFRDYAALLARSPRYAQVLSSATDASSFARGMQAAGYATDPRYAEKLTRAINHTLALGRLA